MVGLFAIISLVWMAYLFSIQVLDPLELSGFRRLRYVPEKEILIPKRGAIYDSKGDLLISSISFYQVDIDRGQIDKWAKRNDQTLDEAYQKVSEIFSKNTSLTQEFVMRRLTMGNRLTSIQISNRIKESELDNLIKDFREARIGGLLNNFSYMRRIYSKDRLAARVLGSVREYSDGGPQGSAASIYKLSGICGIEASADQALSGEYGWREIVLDANNERVPYPNLRDKKPQNGNNVWLTIDSRIQEIVEEALNNGLDEYHAKNAAAVVMNPKTGKIIAMAGISATDRSEAPNLVRTKPNIPVSFMFEPGSTMKPLTIIPALENKLVKPTERIPVGELRIGRRRIKDTHHYEPLTIREIIAKSSNVGVVKIADRIGSQKMYEKLIALGFGQKTGLGIFGETSGIFAKLENWDGYSLHSISFGQSISVTAIQLNNAYCAVANGGRLMKPYIIDSYRDEEGNIIEQFEPIVLRQVSTKAAADTVRSYLQSVVDSGTGRNLKLNYVTLGGKTGTAQKKLEGMHGYAGDKYTSVFTGMFPVENPEYVITVLYDEPARGLHYGSLSAAPTFKKIVENILFMPDSNILPFSNRLMENSLSMPDLVGQSLQRAEYLLNQYGFKYKIEGPDSASVVIDQFPKPNVAVDMHHPITVKIGKSVNPKLPVIEQGVMPNLIGLTVRKALQYAAQHQINVKINGMGIVRSQSILPGSRIISGASCKIEASI